jgi:hypothetical protein
MKVVVLISLCFFLPVNSFANDYDKQGRWEYEKMTKKPAPANMQMAYNEIWSGAEFPYEKSIEKAFQRINPFFIGEQGIGAILAVKGSKHPLLPFAVLIAMTKEKELFFEEGWGERNISILPQSLRTLEVAKKAISECGVSPEAEKLLWKGDRNGSLGKNLSTGEYAGACSKMFATYVNFYVMDKILTHLVEKNNGSIEQAIREYGQALGKGEDFVDGVEWMVIYLAFKK